MHFYSYVVEETGCVARHGLRFSCSSIVIVGAQRSIDSTGARCEIMSLSLSYKSPVLPGTAGHTYLSG